MELGRRAFAGFLLAAAAALAWPLARRLLPARWVEAVRGRLYPGPVLPLDPAGVRRPGRWAG